MVPRNPDRSAPPPARPPATAILGLDLAERVGVCVLAIRDHRRLWSDSLLLARRDAAERLLTLRRLLLEIIARYPHLEMAVEDVFLPARTSRKTPISLGELRGVARLCAAEADIPVIFYPPATVKQTITGSGRASKEDVVRWIEAEFGYRVKDHNEADAISIAYTHWLSRTYRQQLSVNIANPVW
ncbi:MAG: Crossover junction endodeoxyribonuclease RuvC [Candidatus Ozemobacter sibiricus]|uniref:Crossover junction endodeoxyribonuclease RuvC n=1 Tax=Candidatus Ozemobacter sibiricus TaxID=2268124 RepID=A0A367ZB86_9BACT|nr:MAG: Crossover junction endodeoxyribonuclease RuvC [Candidatus Ozemobacter sibiricus]